MRKLLTIVLLFLSVISSAEQYRRNRVSQNAGADLNVPRYYRGRCENLNVPGGGVVIGVYTPPPSEGSVDGSFICDFCVWDRGGWATGGASVICPKGTRCYYLQNYYADNNGVFECR